MNPIAENEPFVLYDRHKEHGAWISLKLIRTGPRKKEDRKWNWWLGWNGDRLARNKDAGLLHEHHPEIYGWVVTTLRELKHG